MVGRTGVVDTPSTVQTTRVPAVLIDLKVKTYETYGNSFHPRWLSLCSREATAGSRPSLKAGGMRCSRFGMYKYTKHIEYDSNMLVECSAQGFYILSVNLPYPFSVAKRKKVHIRAGQPLKNALYI